MASYAEGTTVSVEKSRMEIEATLRRYKADAFGYATDGRTAGISFRMKERYVRFKLELPDPKHRDFLYSSRGPRSPENAEAAWEAACRQKWRALALVIKAKLEAVSAGITTVEDEFLAHTVLPNNTTVGDWAREQVTEAYRIGQMPSPILAITGPQ